MANWISSKLKAAESILQQIDQQAAESLRKTERPHGDESNRVSPSRTGSGVPLKDQLKKKNVDDYDYHGKLRSDPNFRVLGNGDNESASTPSSSPKTQTKLTDSDWTELLSTPPKQRSPLASNRSNGGSSIRGSKKEFRRPGTVGSTKVAQDGKRNQKNKNNVHHLPRQSSVTERINGKVSDGEEARHFDSALSFSSDDVNKGENETHSAGTEFRRKQDQRIPSTEPKTIINEDYNRKFEKLKLSSVDSSPVLQKSHPSGMRVTAGKTERLADVKIGMDDVEGKLAGNLTDKLRHDVTSAGSASDKVRRDSSTTDETSGSDSISGSDSESENEREERKRRRQKILAEKAAAKAVEAIKERENMVARLEGEKDSLEKILEEQARKQALEASELQSTMMETMEAVELEKQKHNNTRKEALARLAKLETVNAELAKSLASVQRNLEVEVNRVAELRQQIELKEATHGELRRRISSSHQTRTSRKEALKGVVLEREIIEADISRIREKVLNMQEKAKILEENIEMTRKETEEPTEVEIELKRRLGQMTDHLIQKQSQVENLSSEKASLVFRIEAAARLLEEGKTMLPSMSDISSSSSRDLESGAWELPDSRLRPLLKNIHSGRQHLGSLLRQLETLYVAGAVYLRKNKTAKIWCVVYLACLHFWVIYILFSRSQSTNEARSGAVFSLENINTS